MTAALVAQDRYRFALSDGFFRSDPASRSGQGRQVELRREISPSGTLNYSAPVLHRDSVPDGYGGLCRAILQKGLQTSGFADLQEFRFECGGSQRNAPRSRSRAYGQRREGASTVRDVSGLSCYVGTLRVWCDAAEICGFVRIERPGDAESTATERHPTNSIPVKLAMAVIELWRHITVSLQL